MNQISSEIFVRISSVKSQIEDLQTTLQQIYGDMPPSMISSFGTEITDSIETLEITWESLETAQKCL